MVGGHHLADAALHQFEVARQEVLAVAEVEDVVPRHQAGEGRADGAFGLVVDAAGDVPAQFLEGHGMALLATQELDHQFFQRGFGLGFRSRTGFGQAFCGRSGHGFLPWQSATTPVTRRPGGSGGIRWEALSDGQRCLRTLRAPCLAVRSGADG